MEDLSKLRNMASSDDVDSGLKVPQNTPLSSSICVDGKPGPLLTVLYGRIFAAFKPKFKVNTTPTSSYFDHTLSTTTTVSSPANQDSRCIYHLYKGAF